MTKEEKAKEYAMLECGYRTPDCKPEYCNAKCQWFINSYVHENTRAFKRGYTAAEQDLSSQLSACKDALRELIQDIEAQVYEDKELVDHIQNLNHLDRSIAKAKTLIE